MTLQPDVALRLVLLLAFGAVWLGGLAALERWTTRHDRPRRTRRRW